MTTPKTQVDARFSEPGTTGTSWSDARRALDGSQLFWISTVRADGRPHITPLVAIWLDDALHFCTGGAEQKAVNLRGNRKVILMTGCNRWDDGLDVVVEGEAVQVTDQDSLRRLAEAWTRKWDGRWQYQVGEGGFYHDGGDELVLVFSVRPAKVLAFAKGDFSHTRHLF
jgi:general stress protein 26